MLIREHANQIAFLTESLLISKHTHKVMCRSLSCALKRNKYYVTIKPVSLSHLKSVDRLLDLDIQTHQGPQGGREETAKKNTILKATSEEHGVRSQDQNTSNNTNQFLQLFIFSSYYLPSLFFRCLNASVKEPLRA